MEEPLTISRIKEILKFLDRCTRYTDWLSKKADWMFNKFDSEQKGYLTLDDFGDLVIDFFEEVKPPGTPIPRPEDIDLWFEVHDSDNDGKLERVSMEDIVKRMFSIAKHGFESRLNSMSLAHARKSKFM